MTTINPSPASATPSISSVSKTENPVEQPRSSNVSAPDAASQYGAVSTPWIQAIGTKSPTPSDVFLQDLTAQFAERDTAYFFLSTPVGGFFKGLIAGFHPERKLNAEDKAKIALVKEQGYRYQVTVESKDFGDSYYRLKVFENNAK